MPQRRSEVPWGSLTGALEVPEICLVPSEVPQRGLRCALKVPETCPRERSFRGTLEVLEGRLGGAQQVPQRCLRGVLEVFERPAR